jgi:hypothetical protein
MGWWIVRLRRHCRMRLISRSFLHFRSCKISNGQIGQAGRAELREEVVVVVWDGEKDPEVEIIFVQTHPCARSEFKKKEKTNYVRININLKFD